MIESPQQTLQNVVDEQMRRFGVPGVAVGLLRDGVEDTAGFGVTSIENPLPVNADTLFQIGSITKTFTATAVMRLAEQRRLDLDAPLRQYLPDLRLADPEVGAAVNLRHLLTHTAGFEGDDFTDTGHGDDAVARYVAHMVELPQVCPLGHLFSYCNSGFVLAGRVIEVVTGQPYERAIRDLVLDPLDMQSSTFDSGEVMLRRFVVGHTSPFTEDGEQIRIARPWGLPRAINPAGGLVSSVRDLLKYARLHLGYGPAGVLSEDSRRAMQAPLAQAGNFADSVGVAWMLRSVAGSRIVEHGGGTNGQQTTFKLLPDQPCALIILTNSSRGAELHAELAGWIMREYLGLQDSAPTPIELPTERLHEYVGHYERSTDMVDVNVDRGQLVLQATPKRGFPTKDSPPGPTPPPVHFAFWSEDRIIGLEPPFKDARAEFLRDADNRIVWLRAGGRLTARQ